MKRQGTIVRATGQIVGTIDGYLQLFSDEPPFGRPASRRGRCTITFTTCRLGQLGLTASGPTLTASRRATHLGVFEQNGSLIHSWRVLVDLHRGDSIVPTARPDSR